MSGYYRVHPVAVGSPPPPHEQQQVQDNNGKKPERDDQELLPIKAPPAYYGPAPAPLAPPPARRPKRKHSRCCRCVCFTLLAVVLLAVALGATAGILYAVFKPIKIPKFTVDRLAVTRFDVNTTAMTLNDAFEVQVTSENPNKRIGIYYDGGEVSASFNGTELCSGPFPALYQGHRTTVRPLIRLTGETRLDSAVAAQLVQQQQAGFVPLAVNARVPIRIKFGVIRLWTMTAKARCRLVVDTLQAGTRLRIRSNTCNFKLKI